MRLPQLFSDKISISMATLQFLSIVLVFVVSTVTCESYNKACFLNYMLQHDLLDKTYQIFNNGEKVDEKCNAAVAGVIAKLRSSSNDSCISDFLRRKYVSETLIKEYLIPQFKSAQTEVHFDDRFTIFKDKAINVSSIICNNKDVFRPDLKAMMRNGRLQKESKTKEIECLHRYIMIKNKPLDAECKKVVDMIKEEFYKSTENDMKRVFLPPNDKLINLRCSEEKAKKSKLFEKFFFFVVLAATRNMNDKQIDTLLKGAEGVVTGSTRLIFECMV